jgi:hypothetical protein
MKGRIKLRKIEEITKIKIESKVTMESDKSITLLHDFVEEVATVII